MEFDLGAKEAKKREINSSEYEGYEYQEDVYSEYEDSIEWESFESGESEESSSSSIALRGLSDSSEDGDKIDLLVLQRDRKKKKKNKDGPDESGVEARKKRKRRKRSKTPKKHRRRIKKRRKKKKTRPKDPTKKIHSESPESENSILIVHLAKERRRISKSLPAEKTIKQLKSRITTANSTSEKNFDRNPQKMKHSSTYKKEEKKEKDPNNTKTPIIKQKQKNCSIMIKGKEDTKKKEKKKSSDEQEVDKNLAKNLARVYQPVQAVGETAQALPPELSRVVSNAEMEKPTVANVEQEPRLLDQAISADHPTNTALSPSDDTLYFDEEEVSQDSPNARKTRNQKSLTSRVKLDEHTPELNTAHQSSISNSIQFDGYLESMESLKREQIEPDTIPKRHALARTENYIDGNGLNMASLSTISDTRSLEYLLEELRPEKPIQPKASEVPAKSSFQAFVAMNDSANNQLHDDDDDRPSEGDPQKFRITPPKEQQQSKSSSSNSIVFILDDLDDDDVDEDDDSNNKKQPETTIELKDISKNRNLDHLGNILIIFPAIAMMIDVIFIAAFQIMQDDDDIYMYFIIAGFRNPKIHLVGLVVIQSLTSLLPALVSMWSFACNELSILVTFISSGVVLFARELL